MEGKSLLAMTLAIRMQPKAAGTLVICPSGGLLKGLSSLFFGFSEIFLFPLTPNQF